MSDFNTMKTNSGKLTSLDHEFAKYVIAQGLPFDLGESIHTLQFFNSLNPFFKLVSQNQVLQQASAQLDNTKVELRSNFASIGKNIALACDVWCNQQISRHFLCVTAHWIDTDWVMQRRVIDFIWLDLDDYDNDILNRTKECMVSWGISDKVFAFTSDDVTNNVVVVEGLKDVFRPVLDGRLFLSNCVVRRLNSCVEKGWENVRAHVDMIWRGVCIVRSNFKVFCERYGYEPKRTIFYDERKWDSIRELLRTFIPYKDAVTEFVADKKYGDGDTEPFVPIVIGELDWEVASMFCRLLDVFYEAVDDISGNYKPSSCVVLRQLVNVAKLFSELKESPLFRVMFSAMKVMFLKDFGKIPEIYCVAAVMDPRIKLSGCECLLGAFYQYTNNVATNVAGVSKLLQGLYNLYAVKSTKCQFSSRDPAMNDHAWSLINRKRKKMVDSAFEELTIYLQTPPLSKYGSGNLDILAWWKKNENNYPVLASMARDLLTIPVSTLAPDCAFILNKDKQILDERACELSDRSIKFSKEAMGSFKKQLELRTCLKDWLHAALRIQGNRALEYDKCLGPYPEDEGRGSGYHD